MRILTLLPAVTVLVLLTVSSGRTAPGDLDPTFGIDGKVATSIYGDDDGRAIALDGNGRILVAGSTTDGTLAFAIARYESNGRLDDAFAGHGITGAHVGVSHSLGSSIAIDSVGRAVVAGSCSITSPYITGFGLMRWDTAGNRDQTFGDRGQVTTQTGGFGSSIFFSTATVIDSDERILVAGSSTQSGYNWEFTLARYYSDGMLDLTFGSNGISRTDFSTADDYGKAIAIDRDGRVVVAGSANGDIALARYEVSGNLDPTFGSGGKVVTGVSSGNDSGNAVVIDRSGRIVVAGSASGDFMLARYDLSGSLDPTFGSGGIVTTDWALGNDSGNSLAIDGAGRLVVAGSSDGAFALARYDASGALDATFGTGGRVTTEFGDLSDEGRALVIDSSDRIIVAGSYKTGNSYGDFALARYQGGPTCGNGLVELGESCDGGASSSSECCSATCQFEMGPQAGCNDGIPCTVDICDGAGACVSTPDDFACDDGEICSLDACSVTLGCEHIAEIAGVVCRVSGGVCDVAELCDGANLTCPVDEFALSNTICRVAVDECDVPEPCPGTSVDCPEDGFQPAGFGCGSDSESCTLDVCDGAGGCVHPAGNSGVTCRAAVGVCDVAETCDGLATTCPADGFASSSTSCRLAAGICDVAENCTGSSAVCPPDGIQPTGVECRPAVGSCDVAEACDGAGVTCPTDTGLPDSDGDGVCDAQDVCTNLTGDRDLAIKPKLLVAKVNTDTTPGNDQLLVQGEFVLPAGDSFLNLNPQVNGARVQMPDRDRNVLFDQLLPAGAYTGRGTRGWRAVGGVPAKTWRYIDRTGDLLGGIFRAQFDDRSRKSPGQVRVQVRGRNGTYPVVLGDLPLEGVVVVGNQSDAAVGRCAETRFLPGNCAFNGPLNREPPPP